MSATYDRIRDEALAYRRRAGLSDTNDCGVVAVAAVAGCDYATAHEACRKAGRLPGEGMWPVQIKVALLALGFRVEHHYPWHMRDGRVGLPPRVCRRANRRAGCRESAFKTMITAERYLYRYHRGEKWLAFTKTHVAAFAGAGIADWTAGRRHRVIFLYRVTKRED